MIKLLTIIPKEINMATTGEESQVNLSIEIISMILMVNIY